MQKNNRKKQRSSTTGGQVAVILIDYFYERRMNLNNKSSFLVEKNWPPHRSLCIIILLSFFLSFFDSFMPSFRSSAKTSTDNSFVKTNINVLKMVQQFFWLFILMAVDCNKRNFLTKFLCFSVYFINHDDRKIK